MFIGASECLSHDGNLLVGYIQFGVNDLYISGDDVPLPNTWSRRARQVDSTGEDFGLIYNDLPQAFRVQVMKLLRRTIGSVDMVFPTWGDLPPSIACWRRIHETLSSEFGVFQLGRNLSPYDNVVEYFMASRDIDQLLDCLDVCFSAVVNEVSKWDADEHRQSGADTGPKEAIEILNARFAEHGIGFRYQNEMIVRIDNELINIEVVLPAMKLISDPAFSGANDEFLTALDHHRHGRQKETILGAVQAFESTMKTICALRGWSYDPKDAAKKLIDVMLKNKLIPMSMQTQFHSLRTVLESGAPTLRNGVPGHGQGVEIVNIPEEIAGYAINLVAANIVLLVSANRRHK